ncbi:ribosome-inactivating protein [Xylaria intraflava]|nr:ribosome-inactivating protein [Xylaria intraflava]
MAQPITLDVNEGAQEYLNFIVQLRRTFAGPDEIHGLQILPDQPTDPRNDEMIEVLLRTDVNEGIRLSLRRSNLYVVGFRNEAGAQWFEVSENAASPHLVPGSTFLGFDGSYTELQRDATHRRDIELGYQALVGAINELRNLNGRPSGDQIKRVKRALIIIIEMISESARFARICDLLFQNWDGGLTPSTDNLVVEMENEWSDLSDAVLHYRQNGETGWNYSLINPFGITDYYGAAALLAMLLVRQTGPGARMKREVADTHLGTARYPWDDYPHGRALVEVFWLRIDNIDGENPGDLYGTVTATDGLSSQYLFNLGKSNYVSISPGQFALLTGPSRCISALGEYTLKVDLWDYDSLSPDDSIANGEVSWNPFNKNTYNQLVDWEIPGPYGKATMRYIVLDNASQALLEIVLINGDGEDPANVYGNIGANNGSDDIELFRKSSDEYVDVRPNTDIPLLRNAIAVPVHGELKVTALLYDQDSLSPDDEIANGTAFFTPKILQSEKQTITGAYGSIEVRVTWT